MECNFCKKTFSTKGNLYTHQATAKYCLKIQKKDPDTIHVCSYCSKTFTRKDVYDKHINSHLTDPVTIKIQQENSKMEEELKELKMKLEYKDELKELKMKLEHKDETLKNALEQVNSLQDKIANISMKAVSAPKVKNTYNTVNIENFTAMTDEHFQNNAKHLTIEHIKNGAHGYATFIVKYPCKDSVVVADRSRRTIKYKDENNELCIDVEARNLLTKISKAIDPINRQLLLKAGEDLDANNNMDLEYKLSLKSKFLEYCNGIRFMDGPPTEFSRKLAYELMILIPKRINSVRENLLENVKENDTENIVSDTESIESEVIYYSDS